MSRISWDTNKTTPRHLDKIGLENGGLVGQTYHLSGAARPRVAARGRVPPLGGVQARVGGSVAPSFGPKKRAQASEMLVLVMPMRQPPSPLGHTASGVALVSAGPGLPPSLSCVP